MGAIFREGGLEMSDAVRSRVWRSGSCGLCRNWGQTRNWNCSIERVVSKVCPSER